MQHNVSLPAWSDAPELVKDGVLHVSIHAPAWGATSCRRGNPQLLHVSIHAPAWGATVAKDGFIPVNEFQSTLPRGERQKELALAEVESLFQSTLPRGERLSLLLFTARV